MKKISLIGLLLLTACATSTPPKTIKACADTRPKVCTREYQPVCAFNDAGKKIKTYANACNACSDTKVLGYTAGACS